MRNALSVRMFRTLRRLKPYVVAHKSYLAGALISVLGTDVLTYAIPVAVAYVTDVIYPELQAGGSFTGLTWVFVLLVFSGILRGLAVHSMIRFFWGFAERVVRDVRNATYRKLQHLSLAFYDRSNTGDLMSRVTYDIQLVRNFLAFGVEHRIRIVVISITIFALMLYVQWQLALAVYTIVPVFMTITLMFSRRMRTAVIEQQKQMGRLNTRIQENLSGIRVVKAFAAEACETERFRKTNEHMLDADLKASLLQASLNPILMISDGIGGLIVLLYGGLRVIEGSMSLGVLLGFISYLGILRFPISILAFNTATISMADGASERLRALLDTPDQKAESSGRRSSRVIGKVEFEHVSFQYENAQPVLRDISFTIEAGERVALFGLTGSGKSTLISLIPRYYPPSSGLIRIDGVDSSAWKLQSLRSQIGIVLQETFLFSASIASNIAFARPDASIEQIRAAAKRAQIDDFIMSLPRQYDTLVGEYGVGVSGGQKQRIAIARTLLQDPAMLILDDCTSSLDAETERQIQRQLARLAEGRTTIIVAQRVSTLELADRIVVLADGHIADIDSHSRLYERNTLYRSAVQSQNVLTDTSASEL
ncbi:MAG: ABC transporter ATP-binding protein [Spirochaetaceae bacterium]|nr:MAG: ABC transporter ATP-binding protein [Spirochaetaceae bacterium]